MSEQEKPSLEAALKRWREKRLPTKFKEVKRISTLPHYAVKFSQKLQGRLFKIISEYEFSQETCLMFFKKDIGRLGTFVKKIPVEENVLATGKVADYKIKEDRKEFNAIEVLTTKGVGFVFWKNLVELNKNIPEPMAESSPIQVIEPN